MISPKALERRKRAIEQRLRRAQFFNSSGQRYGQPVFSATNIEYELAERTKAISYGGIGVIHKLAHQSGLVNAIDRRLNLLKLYLPYRESDHVLNIAYNALCEGHTLQDIELRRNDETFLDALGAVRIPDPTTAGDFCRRFTAADIGRLQDAVDEARLNVWARQGDDFFEQATIDMDGSLVGTNGRASAFNSYTNEHAIFGGLAARWESR